MPKNFAKARALPGLAVLTLAAGVMAAPIAFTSSHREAPGILDSPQLDNTDVYVFTSPDRPDTATLIANWLPFEEPGGGPNFYPFSQNARYEIHVDNNADAKADITYRWTFRSSYKNSDTFLYNTGRVDSLNDPDLNFTQRYTLERVSASGTETVMADAPVAPSHVGNASMPNYEKLSNQAITSGGGLRSFAGQADDSFFLDLRVFDLLYGADLSEVGNDTLDGYNVNTIALQVPKAELARGGNGGDNPIIGVWSTTSRPSAEVRGTDGRITFQGDFVQVSRLGMPLVNEVVVPVAFKDRFNASKPENDAQFLPKVVDPELPKLIQGIYKLPAPPAPRNDIVSVFLTGVEGLNKPANVTPGEMIRLNLATPANRDINAGNRLGVLGGDTGGFPNGRRLIDDVVDIELQVVQGELAGRPNDLGDGVDTNDRPFRNQFPYMALPTSGSAVDNRTTGATARAPGTPASAVGGTQTPDTGQGTEIGGNGNANNRGNGLEGLLGGLLGSLGISTGNLSASGESGLQGAATGVPLVPLGLATLGIVVVVGGLLTPRLRNRGRS